MCISMYASVCISTGRFKEAGYSSVLFPKVSQVHRKVDENFVTNIC